MMATIEDRLVGALYAAVDDPTFWVGLMDILRRHLHVECVAAQLLAPSRNMLLPIWGTRDSQSERNGPLHDCWANSPANPRFRRPSFPRAELEIGSDARCRTFSQRDRRALYEGLAGCGLGPAFWISQQLDDDHSFVMIFHRSAGDERDMEQAEETLLSALAPHFRQAIRLWARLMTLEARVGLVERANDATMNAMLACDQQLRVHWCNSEAKAMLAALDVLHMRDGYLTAGSRTEQERLLALVQGRWDRAVMTMGGIDHPAIHLRVRPVDLLPNQLALSQNLVLLQITWPDRAVRYDPADLAMLFGLTTTEATLAASLAAGGSVSEFAITRGIAEGTARLHLKRVLAKTGTGRQSELVRRISRSVADGQIIF